ncbi:MAG: PQQ-binding-like beta-propeller repeat protein [Bacteroidia bacterium]|nr:PQQ-binding-like beta-propeller repeat protein [Bacteroidia bacterium]
MRLLPLMICAMFFSACGSASDLDSPINGQAGPAQHHSDITLPDAPLHLRWEHSLDGYAGRNEILLVQDYALLSSITGIIDVVDIPSGEQKGRINAQGYVHAAPVAVSNRLYLIALAEQSTLQCHSLDDASLLWSADIEASDASVCVSGDNLFLVSRGGTVMCFGLHDSIPKWTRRLSGAFSAGLVAEDSLLFVCGANGDLSALSAVSGAVRWTQASGEAILVAPAADDGVVCAVTRNGTLIAAEAQSGTVRFIRKFNEPVHVSPLMTKHGIVVALSGGDIVWVDALDGRELRRVRTGRLPGATPVPASGGLLLLARDGRVHALGDGSDETVLLAAMKLRSSVRPLLTVHGVLVVDEEGNASLFGRQMEKGAGNAVD